MGVMRIMEVLKNMVVGSLVEKDSLILEKDEEIIQIIDLFDFELENNSIVLHDLKKLKNWKISLDEYEIKTGFENVVFKSDRDEYRLSFV